MMELKIMEKCNCNPDCEAKDYFIFKTRLCQIGWFDDYGYKFLYVRIGKKHWRWEL